MKRFTCLFVAIFFALRLCAQNPIGSNTYLQQVDKDFQTRKEQFPNRFSELSRLLLTCSNEKAYALKYLYAYMPLSDLADYNDSYFEKQVEATFEAIHTMPWANQLKPELIRHYILPIRVNTENLDTARQYCFSQLQERVKGLSMTEAAQEVNHWCHEKVVYKSTDGRTSAPLATIRTAYGRCGEESTLLVAALRAVGIPARQVYTPRWAHSDDNHAWVEMWVDGAWHYTGACEPESVLDKGWFTGPAKRAMMMHTKVFGRFEGTEEVLEIGFGHVRINILSNYATTQEVKVRVVDASGLPVKNAELDFGLYNYAEFYPLATRKTDDLGYCSLNTGKGDLMIWVKSNQGYGQMKVDTRISNHIDIKLSTKPFEGIEMFEMNPPAELPVTEMGSEEGNLLNQYRLGLEDGIRSVYVESFPSKQIVIKKAEKLRVNADSLWDRISKSAGNSSVLFALLESNLPKAGLALRLLYGLSDKDLRDANFAVLNEAVQSAIGSNAISSLEYDYVYNPRISLEQLKPFRKELERLITKSLKDSCRKNPSYVYQRFSNFMELGKNQNYYAVLLSPSGVSSLQACDKLSYQVFCVAMLRTMQIPARIETARNVPQAWKEGRWIDLFEDISGRQERVKVEIALNGSDSMYTPVYGIHFSLARLENGRFKTLDYEGDPVFSKFPATLELPLGTYRLLSSIRSSSGSVKGTLEYFELKDGMPLLTKQIRLFQLQETTKVLGKLDAIPNSIKKQLAPQGLILVWIDPVKEPSRHVLAEMQDIKKRFEDWGGKLLILFNDKQSKLKMDTKKYPSLPINCIYQVDEGLELQKNILGVLGKDSHESYPIMVFVNEKGQLSAYSSGYAIGNVERISKAALNELYCTKPSLKP